jgi:hypothetical protein
MPVWATLPSGSIAAVGAPSRIAAVAPATAARSSPVNDRGASREPGPGPPVRARLPRRILDVSDLPRASHEYESFLITRDWHHEDLTLASLGRCGHDRSTHRHYRRGSDCALCDCPRWSRQVALRQFARRLMR